MVGGSELPSRTRQAYLLVGSLVTFFLWLVLFRLSLLGVPNGWVEFLKERQMAGPFENGVLSYFGWGLWAVALFIPGFRRMTAKPGPTVY